MNMLSKISASAMKYGLVLGALFASIFLFASSRSAALGILSNVILVFSVVYTYRFSIRFREIENNGAISYGNAFLYVLLLYFFGSIISGAVIFLYTKVINPAFLTTVFSDPGMKESISMMKSMTGLPEKQIEQSINMLLSPAMYTLQYIWGNTFLGIITGLVMAIFIKKSPQPTKGE